MFTFKWQTHARKKKKKQTAHISISSQHKIRHEHQMVSRAVSCKRYLLSKKKNEFFCIRNKIIILIKHKKCYFV